MQNHHTPPQHLSFPGPDHGSSVFVGEQHPWRRYFARLLDTMAGLSMLTLSVSVVLALMAEWVPGLGAIATAPPIVAVVVASLMFLPLEALLLSSFGATPGKRLFGIRVTHPSGDLLSFSEALQRAARVWMQGQAFLIPLVALIPQLLAYRRLTKTGTTLWDDATHAAVFHQAWGRFRALLCTLVMLCVLILLSVLNAVGNGSRNAPFALTNRAVIPAQADAARIQYERGLEYLTDPRARYENAEAVKRFRLAAERGHAFAQFVLGSSYDAGHGVPQDYAEAVRWYRLAAAQGNAFAQGGLGRSYDVGHGVPQDYAEAQRWYGLAATRDKGVPRYSAEDLKWLLPAAAQGNAVAQFNLGMAYRGGDGVPKDHAEAEKWFRLAAEQGNASAQYALATLCRLRRYRQDTDLKQDDAEAVKWYRLAAAQGLADAQSGLGAAFFFGRGVPEDYFEAVRWYRLAAAQGNAVAQFNLGMAYRGGDGMPKDYAEAAKWFRLAATQGSADAQNDLGKMYEGGQGVPRNRMVAYALFNLARAAGDRQAIENLTADQFTTMPASEIAQAQALSRRMQAPGQLLKALDDFVAR